MKLIQKVVDALCQERSEIAWLILDEFGVERANLWHDAEKIDHFMAMLRGANDEILTEIAAHLNLSHPSLPTDSEAERRLWRAGFCRCFLSHTSKHKVQAASLKAELEQYGCDVFVAHEDIVPTAEWRREIEAALATCHCLLALLTDDFHGSNWTDQESGFVLGRGLPVVSIRAGKDPYGLMDKLQAVPFNADSPRDAAEPIFVALNNKQPTAKHVASGAVQAFLDSEHYADAKKRMGIVERVTALTPELRQYLKNDAMKNGQIAGSRGVPDRLKQLIDPIF